jgi:hypothetical protein
MNHDSMATFDEQETNRSNMFLCEVIHSTHNKMELVPHISELMKGLSLIMRSDLFTLLTSDEGVRIVHFK